MSSNQKEQTISTMANLPLPSKVSIIRTLIRDAEDKIFSVVFTKKDGTLREMVCRRGVKKGVKGTSKYDVQEADKRNDQITVYDMVNKGFRKINVDTIHYIRTNGVTYQFVVHPHKGTNDILKKFLWKELIEKATETYHEQLRQYGLE